MLFLVIFRYVFIFRISLRDYSFIFTRTLFLKKGNKFLKRCVYSHSDELFWWTCFLKRCFTMLAYSHLLFITLLYNTMLEKVFFLAFCLVAPLDDRWVLTLEGATRIPHEWDSLMGSSRRWKFQCGKTFALEYGVCGQCMSQRQMLGIPQDQSFSLVRKSDGAAKLPKIHDLVEGPLFTNQCTMSYATIHFRVPSCQHYFCLASPRRPTWMWTWKVFWYMLHLPNWHNWPASH